MRRVVAIAAGVLVAMLPAVVAAAQAAAQPPATKPSDVPPLRLFTEPLDKDKAPTSWTGSIKSWDLWQPPSRATEVPRWKIGRTVTLTAPGGVAFSGGFFGRRGDPLPLYLSEGMAQTESAPGIGEITGAGTYRTQWDLKFGVSAPVWNSPHLNIRATGELFLPLTHGGDPIDPGALLLNSRTFRFGVVTIFK